MSVHHGLVPNPIEWDGDLLCKVLQGVLSGCECGELICNPLEEFGEAFMLFDQCQSLCCGWVNVNLCIPPVKYGINGLGTGVSQCVEWRGSASEWSHARTECPDRAGICV